MGDGQMLQGNRLQGGRSTVDENLHGTGFQQQLCTRQMPALRRISEDQEARCHFAE